MSPTRTVNLYIFRLPSLILVYYSKSSCHNLQHNIKMSVQILFWLVSLAFALPQISARGSSAGLIPIQSGSGFYKPEIFDASNVNSTKRDLPHLQKRAWQGCWLNLPPIPEADISYLETLWQDSAITWDLWLMKPFYYYWFTLSDGTEFCVYNRNNVYTNMQYWEMGWGVSYESCCSDSTWYVDDHLRYFVSVQF